MRINYAKVRPEAQAALAGVQRAIKVGGLEPELLELIKIRSSQLNGCTFCLDMHTKDARAAGETEQRLFLVAAWREAPVYSERERAALAWCEAVTLVSESGVPDDVYALVAAQFDEGEIVDLTVAVIAINGWNRMAVAMRSPVGNYQPRLRTVTA